MSLLAPGALWFAFLIPLVVLFYLLKRKRVVRLVSSTVLWQRFLADAQVSAPFQKLRRNWLLLLQIVVLVLAVLALSRPYFRGRLSSNRLYVVVLDASASMQSTDEIPSRFDKARVEALGLVDSLRDADQMIVLQAGGQAAVRQSATSNKPALRRALEACVVTDTSTRLTEALKMAEALTRDNSDAEVHLFSDGAAPDLSELDNKGLRLVYHRVGIRATNLGITQMEARSVPDNQQECALFASVANVSPEARETQVEFRFDGQLVDTRLLTLPATNTASVVFRAVQPHDGVFSVRLTASDDLPVDNEAVLARRLPRPVRVYLVSAGNVYLERALRAAGQVDLQVSTDLSEMQPEADIVVLDNVNPTVWPNASVLAFRAVKAGWFESVRSLENPAIVDWRSAHPLLRYVSFDDVHVAQALEVPPPSWGVPVVESPQSPLMLAGDWERRRIVWVGFDLWESDWPLRVSFPIFIANALDWLNPVGTQSEQTMISTGDPIRLTLEPGLTSARIVRPDGETLELALNPEAGELIYGQTEQQGVYRVLTGTNEVTFCANLLDPAETDTQPRTELDFGRFGEVRATAIHPADLEMWRTIVAVGLGMLLLEWWYYHRRTA